MMLLVFPPRYSYGNERVGGAAQALADYELVVTPYGLLPNL